MTTLQRMVMLVIGGLLSSTPLVAQDLEPAVAIVVQDGHGPTIGPAVLHREPRDGYEISVLLHRGQQVFYLGILQGDWLETEALFEGAPLVGPTLGVLLHQVAQTFQGAMPTLLALDEAWRALASLPFRAQIEAWLRELRQLQGNMVFSTQGPTEILTSPLASVLLNQCRVRLFLPNAQAPAGQHVEAYTALGLTIPQRDPGAQAIPHHEYLLCTPPGIQMIDLALGPEQRTILTEGVVSCNE